MPGPPGTGKTTTIAAALEYWQARDQPAWVIAHSNVGVKNIAESLVKRNIDFKLIVSHDFYYEWYVLAYSYFHRRPAKPEDATDRHEHHYVDLSDQMVESTKLFEEARGVETFLGSSKIILCTVAMLSNPQMDNHGVFKRVPMERLVVDEASQIDTLEFFVSAQPLSPPLSLMRPL